MLPAYSARPDQVERVLKGRFHEAMTKLQPQGKELDLLIVILPDNNGSLYGTEIISTDKLHLLFAVVLCVYSLLILCYWAVFLFQGI